MEKERWEVRAKNHTFLLECNRPTMLSAGEKHLPWEWILIAGTCPIWFKNDMQAAMEKVLRNL